MRVAFLPNIGVRYASDSDFLTMFDFAKLSYDAGRKDFFYMAFPKWIIERDGVESLPKLPNMEYVPVETPKNFVHNEFYVPDDFIRAFARRGGKYIVDAVLTSRVTAAGYISIVLSDFRYFDDIPVFVYDPVFWDFPYRGNKKHVANILHAFAYSACFPLCFTQENANAVFSFYREYFNAAVMRKLMAATKIYNRPVDVKKFEEVEKSQLSRKYQNPTIFYGTRINAHKSPDWTLGLFNMCKIINQKVGIVITTPTSEKKSMEFIEPDLVSLCDKVVFACSHDRYVVEAARCHLFVYASFAEAYPTSITELLLLGLVGVFPKLGYVTHVLGDDYPFYVDPQNWKDAEIMRLLKYIINNYDEAKKKIEPVVKKLKKTLDGETNVKVILEEMESKSPTVKGVDATDKYRFDEREGSRRSMKSFIIDFVAGKKEFLLLDLVLYLQGKGMIKTVLQFGEQHVGNLSLFDLRKHVISLGFADACDAPNVRMIYVGRKK